MKTGRFVSAFAADGAMLDVTHDISCAIGIGLVRYASTDTGATIVPTRRCTSTIGADTPEPPNESHDSLGTILGDCGICRSKSGCVALVMAMFPCTGDNRLLDRSWPS